MPVLGRAVTFGAVGTDFKELLKALYDDFNGANYPNWTIDGTVTRPTQVSDPGDQGFAIVNSVSGYQIFVSHDTAPSIAGTMANGSAIAGGDDLLIAIDPDGGTTDMTTGTSGLGANFSGWVSDGEGNVTSAGMNGRAKISASDTAVFCRFKTTTGNRYIGGFYAGEILRVATREGSRFRGVAIIAGAWDIWATAAALSHSAYIETNTSGGVSKWKECRVFPRDDGTNTWGMAGDWASDGSGHYTITRPVVCVQSVTYSATNYTWSALGFLDFLLVGPAGGTVANSWEVSAVVKGYNMNGGSWVAEDTNGDAE